MIEASEEQQQALDKASRWYIQHLNGGPQVFRLFGYAGTGKTTLAKSIGQGNARIEYAAYTGKAAQVLTSKGCPASTLHRLIYMPAGEDKDEKGVKQPKFVLNPESELAFADMLIVDEVSMVNEKLAKDILWFNKPVLVLGDPAQLPPIEGGGYFTNHNPDAMLTEIHRQEEGSEVLDIATAVRSGEEYPRIPGCTFGQLAEMDQVIVGTNKTRWRINEQVRDVLGYPPGQPVAGDKIIVLQNNYDLAVMNGETFVVESFDMRTGNAVVLDDYGTRRHLTCWPQGFTAEGEAEVKGMDYRAQKRRVVATFAWAITCHKSQGSQWDHVMVVDEARMFRDMAARWMYTAVTRAAKEVYIVNPSAIRRPTIKPRPGR